MHEMSLAQSIITAIESEAAAQHFSKVTRVVLEVGVLSHVDPHALRFGFDAACKDTLAQSAELDIETPAGAAQCFGCARDVTIARRGEGCPHCGSHQLVVTSGEDMKIKYLEVM